MSIKTEIRAFRRGLQVILGKPPPGQGDRKLAKVAGIVEAQIAVYGKDNVRKQLIKNIESDLKRAFKRGGKPAVDKLVENALATPEYMRLLYKLGMEEPEVRILAMEALRSKGGK